MFLAYDVFMGPKLIGFMGPKLIGFDLQTQRHWNCSCVIAACIRRPVGQAPSSPHVHGGIEAERQADPSGNATMSITRRLAIFLAVIVVVLGAVALVVAPRGWKDTAWRHTLLLLEVTGQENSWKPMGRALDYLTKSPTNSVYTEMLEHQGVKFQYPPTSLVPYALFRQAIAQTPLSQKRGFAV